MDSTPGRHKCKKRPNSRPKTLASPLQKAGNFASQIIAVIATVEPLNYQTSHQLHQLPTEY
jgi:hypothetical protein